MAVSSGFPFPEGEREKLPSGFAQACSSCISFWLRLSSVVPGARAPSYSLRDTKYPRP
jgi:hypothetical protein